MKELEDQYVLIKEPFTTSMGKFVRNITKDGNDVALVLLKGNPVTEGRLHEVDYKHLQIITKEEADIIAEALKHANNNEYDITGVIQIIEDTMRDLSDAIQSVDVEELIDEAEVKLNDVKEKAQELIGGSAGDFIDGVIAYSRKFVKNKGGDT